MNGLYLASLVLALALATPAYGAVFYVRTSGNDANDGRTPATAFATASHAAQQLVNAGDRVVVGAGTYSDGDISPARNGIPNRPIVFVADSTGLLTGDAAGPVVLMPPATRSTGFLVLGRHDIVIDGFTIIGGADAGIQVRRDQGRQIDSHSVSIVNNIVRDGPKGGIDVSASSGVRIEGNSVSGNGSSGIAVQVVGVSVGATVQLKSNSSSANGSAGIRVDGDPGSDATLDVSSNTISANQAQGIVVQGIRGGGIDANDIRNNGGTGMQIRANADLTVSNNVVNNGASVGIDISSGGHVRIAGNDASQNRSVGVSVTGNSGSEATLDLSNNTVTVNQGRGILVQSITGGVIAGNQISDNGDTGMRIRTSSNLTISKNVVRNSPTRGIDASIGGAVLVEGNTASGNGSSGITLQAETGLEATIDVSNNLLTSNRGQGLVIQGISGGSIDGNQISDNGDLGLQIRASSSLSVSNNVVSNARNGGIGIGAGVDSTGDCNADGSVTVDEVLLGVNIVLGQQPVSACPAFDASGTGVVTVTELLRAMNAALGNSGALALGTDIAIVGNSVRSTAGFGIDVHARGEIAVQSNTVLHSDTGGLSIRLLGATATATVTANTLGVSGVAGLFLSGATAGVIQNNVIFSNADTGITVRASRDVQIANNLIYANGSHGVAVGTSNAAVFETSVVNNTVYSNAGFGLVVGSAGAASPGTLVLNNIFNLNAAGGIAFQRLSAEAGYVTDFNLNTDGYGPDTRAGTREFSADPGFVDPPGADGVLGGDGFADDDFRLRTGSTPSEHSAAIDRGSGLAGVLGITGTSTYASPSDDGTVDLGYHYGAAIEQVITVEASDLFIPIYVRVSGSPNNDGSSPQQALNSIRAAGLRATSSATVIVGPGRYSEGDIGVRTRTHDVQFIADVDGALTGELPGLVLVDATGTGAGTVFVVVEGPGTIVDGFYLTGGVDAGIQIRRGSHGARVVNNVVFSNARRGIEALQANDVQIENNLVYANGTGGIRVAESENSVVLNNTAYGNGVDPVLGREANGILVGGGAELGPTRGTVVMRNIVQGNPVGILATNTGLEGYMSGFNVSLDGFPGRTPRADSDLIDDALFINPAGVDGILGAAGFADDDFRLIQDGMFLSPAVDIDYGELGTLRGTTRTDGAPDTGPADAGFHYPSR